eukprot:4240764-Pleurochrysis_carterae.AAC.1
MEARWTCTRVRACSFADERARNAQTSLGPHALVRHDGRGARRHLEVRVRDANEAAALPLERDRLRRATRSRSKREARRWRLFMVRSGV